MDGQNTGRGRPERISSITDEKFDIRRTYDLTPASIKKLNELKYMLTDLTFNEILDEAIDKYYKARKNNNSI